MTTNTTPKTDRQRFHPPMAAVEERISNWDVFAGNRENDFIDGMKAFATNWFKEFSDEQHLPAEWHRLVEIAEGWMLFDDLSELTGDIDDEDDD